MANLRNLSKLLACFLILVVLLTACAAPAAKPTPATTTGASSSTPKMGGTLKMAISQKPTTLDLFVAGQNSPASIAVNKLFNQTLTQWAGKDDAHATLAPLLAKSWDISPDGKTYTFHLREGVKFQNLPPMNGREFTAEDYKYHLERIKDPNNKYQMRTSFDLNKIEVIDKYTLAVTTNAKVPGYLAYTQFDVMHPKEIVEAAGGAAKNTVGVGPYILTDYNPDVKAVFKKNPDYWDKGKPYLDSIELYFMPDAATRMAAFRAGEIDVLPQEGKSVRDNIERTVTGAVIQGDIGFIEGGLLLNNKREPFDKKQVRQAIQYALDCDAIITSALDGAGRRTGYLAPWFSDWGGKEASALPKRDVAKAKALLAEAGFPSGFKTTILQNTGRMETYGNAVEPIVAMLKEVGIDAAIVQADNTAFLGKWRSGDFDMAVGFLLTARPLDPDNSIRQMWKTKTGYNFVGYSNPKVDALINAEQDAFPDNDKRKPMFKEIIGILEDEVPSVPMYITTNYYIKQPWVKGLDNIADIHAYYGVIHLPGAWIDKAK